jgi:hypothetical protein
MIDGDDRPAIVSPAWNTTALGWVRVRRQPGERCKCGSTRSEENRRRFVFIPLDSTIKRRWPLERAASDQARLFRRQRRSPPGREPNFNACRIADITTRANGQLRPFVLVADRPKSRH